MSHDKFCKHNWATPFCYCDQLAAARADERNKAADKVNIAIGENVNLFGHDKLDEMYAWWTALVKSVRDGEQG